MKNKENITYSRALVPKHNTLYKIIIAILLVVIVLLVLICVGVFNAKPKQEVTEEVLNNEETVLDDLYYEDLTNERKVGKTQMKLDYVDNCSFSISYPEIGIEEVDEKILEHARELKRGFLNEYQDSSENASIYSEHVDYKSFIDDNSNLNIVLVDIIAKDNQQVISKNEYNYIYDLSNGSELWADEYKGSFQSGDYAVNEFRSLEDVEEFVFVFSGDIVKFAIAPVNVRTGKSLSSTVIATLKDGQAIEVRSGDDEWETVVYGGKEAYVKAGYLSRKKLLHKDIELEVLDRGIDPSKPMVAITYDDGPNPKSTPRILDTLEKYGVVATFFDLGQLVNSYPDIVRREEEIGCEVGNHSFSHKNFNLLTDEEIQEEIRNSEAAFVKALGHKTVLFRPPYGNANLKVKENLEYPIIKWNVDSLDWKSRNKNKILAQIRATKNYDGHIILMHSIYGTTADATEVLIPELIEKGYQLVTVSELAFYKGHTKLQTAVDYSKF